MATEFTIYRVPNHVDVELMPHNNTLSQAVDIYSDRRPLLNMYQIQDILMQKNTSGDDYAEILPEDYLMFGEWVDLTKYELEGHKFVCCII